MFVLVGWLVFLAPWEWQVLSPVKDHVLVSLLRLGLSALCGPCSCVVIVLVISNCPRLACLRMALCRVVRLLPQPLPGHLPSSWWYPGQCWQGGTLLSMLWLSQWNFLLVSCVNTNGIHLCLVSPVTGNELCAFGCECLKLHPLHLPYYEAALDKTSSK